MSGRRFIFAFALLLDACLAFGREFHCINDELGLAIRQTASVCEDEHGFIWASYKLGVVRFTFSGSKTYRLPREGQAVNINRLTFGNHRLYAHADCGLVYVYDEAQDRFERLCDFAEVANVNYFAINQLLVAPDGSLIAATSVGILKYDESAGLSTILDENRAPNHSSICFDENGNLLAVSRCGLFRVNLRDGRIESLTTGDPRLNATSLYLDASRQRLWIGTRYLGLYYLELSDYSLHQIDDAPTYWCSTIRPYGDDMLIVSYDGGGLWFRKASDGSLVEVESENNDDKTRLGSNGVYDVFCDHDNVFWVATYGGGLYYFRDEITPVSCIRHRVNDDDSLVNDHVNDVFEDSSITAVATDGGVSVMRFPEHRWYHICIGNTCRAIHLDRSGRLWVGTFGNGFFIYDAATLRELEHHDRALVPDGRNPNVVLDFVEDGDGDIWILGNRVMLRKDARTGKYQEYEPYDIQGGCTGPDGLLYLACRHGLLAFDKHTMYERTLAEGMMTDVAMTSDGVWASTSGRGVLFCETPSGACRYLDMNSGLHSNFVNSVLVEEGKLWLGNEVGLDCYDTLTDKVETFPNIIEFSRSNFNAGACWLKADGVQLWGTQSGLLRFDPKLIKCGKPDMRLYVEDIVFSGVSVRDLQGTEDILPANDLKELTVKYSQRNAIFYFNVTGGNREDYRFRWRMERIDGAWSPLSTASSCRYTRLNIGKNAFHLLLTDISGNEVIDSWDMTITVRPPFWLSWWFILIELALLYFLVYSAWTLYAGKLKSRFVSIMGITREVESQMPEEDLENLDDPFVKKAVSVVYAHIQDPSFDKDLFAKEMNVSASSLYKKLKAQSDQSPSEFIKTIRMTNALKLLQSHKYTVTEVGEMCGYSSSSYFSTAFKSFYGKSPNEI